MTSYKPLFFSIPVGYEPTSLLPYSIGSTASTSIIKSLIACSAPAPLKFGINTFKIILSVSAPQQHLSNYSYLIGILAEDRFTLHAIPFDNLYHPQLYRRSNTDPAPYLLRYIAYLRGVFYATSSPFSARIS